MFEQVVEKFASLPQIEAIALGGSRAGSNYDETSDYDIYLYCTGEVPEAVRRDLLTPYCEYLELSNQFWELEDNGIFRNGISFDILYRDLDSFSENVAQTVELCRASNSYTTCMWHNLLTCKILYDKNGRLAAAKQRFDIPYPEKLRQNILRQGWRLLCDSQPAYILQIQKAAARRDWVSVNHRTAAFLETYFDVLFALNGKTHPGEKRLIQLCRQMCPLLPENFEENLNAVFSHMFSSPEKLADDLQKIVAALAKIL